MLLSGVVWDYTMADRTEVATVAQLKAICDREWRC
jgi:hypothetical protein